MCPPENVSAGQEYPAINNNKNMKNKTDKKKTSKIKKHTLPTVFGYTATAVCRALGKHGFKTADVRGIMKAKRVPINDTTVSIQTRAGVNGQRGEPAPLTREQISELKALIPTASAKN